jgi:hypothetical protein
MTLFVDIVIPNSIISWEDFKKTKVVYDLREMYSEQIKILEYKTCLVECAEVVAVDAIRKLGLANAGRFHGNDEDVYDIVDRNLTPGWNINKLPPFVFADDDNPLNGNHRLRWLQEHEIAYVPVLKVSPKSGFSKNDVINELGLKFQPRPDGSPSQFADYKARGILWVIEQNANRQEDDDRITKDEVREWVQEYADFETPDTQNRLIDAIFNATEKKTFLANFTRAEGIRYFAKKGIKIQSTTADVRGSSVDRLVSAMGPVHVYRDFFPQFFEDAANGISTVIHFYVNTNNVEDELGVLHLIKERTDEIEEHITNIGKVLGKSEAARIRSYLTYGYRLPHLVDLDRNNLVALN